MHIEKNIFDNVLNTVKDIKEKTKDNIKARLDLAIYYKYLHLELQQDDKERVYKLKVTYSLTRE